MNRRGATRAVAVLGVAALAGWSVQRAVRDGRLDPTSGAALADTSASTMSELGRRDVQIAVWGQALAQDPASAIALAQLAGLHLQRAREGGEYADYERAEAYARRSLTERTNRNGKTYVTLASSLLAQHRFVEARAVAETLVVVEPDMPQYRALLGEVQLELGDYAGARASFVPLHRARTHLSVAPRLARWAEIEGSTDYARELLRGACIEAARRGDVPREQVAWFHLRLGDFELRHGRLSHAADAFRDGLAVEPGDHRLLAAMARLELARGRPARAAAYGERAIAATLDPATLGVIATAYELLGDSARRDEYARTMEVAVSAEPGPYHRAWSLFLLDENRRVAEVVADARAELRTRRDVYGYDVAAWALYKQGRLAEARAMADTALAQGTQDALLHYHAGMIAHALGDTRAARARLERALAINRTFDPRHAATARATLEAMRGPRWLAVR